MRPTESRALSRARDSGLHWFDVDAVSSISAQRFRDDHVRRNRPLLVRGGADRWPALTRWSDDYLRATLGHCRVPVETSRDQFQGRIFDDVEEVEMTFGEFLDRMHTPAGRYDYLVGHWLRPELRPDIDEHPLMTIMGALYRQRMIMARGGNRIAFHFDPYENLIVQIAGSKRLVLCDPIDTRWLRPLENKVNYSALDMHAIDREAYPDIERARFYEARIEPGDLLYIPTLWWHTVDSFERNIMISSAFVHQHATLRGIVRRLLDSGWYEFSDDAAAATWAVLDSDRNACAAPGQRTRGRGLRDVIRGLLTAKTVARSGSHG